MFYGTEQGLFDDDVVLVTNTKRCLECLFLWMLVESFEEKANGVEAEEVRMQDGARWIT